MSAQSSQYCPHAGQYRSLPLINLRQSAHFHAGFFCEVMAATILRRKTVSREWWPCRVSKRRCKPLLSKMHNPRLCRWNWSLARALALRPALRCVGVILTGNEQNKGEEDQQGRWHTPEPSQRQCSRRSARMHKEDHGVDVAAQYFTCLGAQNKVVTIWPGSQSTAKIGPPAKPKFSRWMTRGQDRTRESPLR